MAMEGYPVPTFDGDGPPDVSFLVQDILSKKWRDWDFRLANPQLSVTLSGPSGLTGNITEQYTELWDAGIEAWSNYIYAQVNGRIFVAGILQPLSLQEQTLSIEALGVSGYPKGIPYLGEYSGIQVDPLDVVRNMWQHLQSFPDGNLGVIVDSSTHTTVRIGTEPQDVSFTTGSGEDVNFSTSEGPYQLNWWDHKDIGDEINNLAKATPFDYVERYEWNAAKTDVNKYIDFGYPRIGRKRFDLTFKQGENILDGVPIQELADTYASDVLFIGAGQGRDAVVGTASQRQLPRIRRVRVFTDQSITSVAQANAISSANLRALMNRISFQEITVQAFHENAPLGSYVVGDDVYVQADIAWLGYTGLWHRIVGYTWDIDNAKVKLTLVPSDAFVYGA